MTPKRKAILDRTNPRGLPMCSQGPDKIWHALVRIDGEWVDKGPCKHDHSDMDDGPGCWCCGKDHGRV